MIRGLQVHGAKHVVDDVAVMQKMLTETFFGVLLVLAHYCPNILSSTRRFCALPSGVVLSAIGVLGP